MPVRPRLWVLLEYRREVSKRKQSAANQLIAALFLFLNLLYFPHIFPTDATLMQSNGIFSFTFGVDTYLSQGHKNVDELKRIVLKSVKHGGEVALTSVWQQNDYFLAFILRTFGHLDGCEESGTGRDTYQQTF